MDGIQVKRLDGEDAVLAPDAVEALGAAVGSQLILGGDPSYEQARRVWNGMIDRRPALIVRCRGVADVVASVRFAREHELLLAVRGGGHNVAGYGTCDGGLVVDLSPARGVRVDALAQTARVAGGATWADVDRETQAFGLAVPGGIVSTTGVAGLTLGGGQGWLRRTYGMTCDHLLSADVVTAEGVAVSVDERTHPDLFWALRGGGGNFGVVTSFEFLARPVGPKIAFAGPVYPLEHAQSVIAGVRRFVADAPDEVNVSATWWTIPPVSGFPEELHGRAVIIVGAVYAGQPEEGERILKPLSEMERPLLDLSTTMPYSALQTMFDPFFPAGELQYYWKSIYLATLDEDAVQAVADFTAARPSALSMVGLWALGGALDRAEGPATAAGARGAAYLLEILANWSDRAESESNIRWAREFFAAMKRFSSGKTNLNFPGLGEDPDFVRAALGDQWDRLARVKLQHDPGNLFRLNQNIEPAG